MKMRFLAGALCVLLGVTACGSNGTAGDGIRVVVTTTVLGDVVSAIVGDEGSVVVLTPNGADPHDFQPSAAQVATINQADLVVANGLALEEGLEEVLEAAAGDGVLVFEVGPELEPLPSGIGDDDHDSLDPHVWLDPLRMAEASRLIARQLDQIAPGGGWQERGERLASDLEDAHQQILTQLDGVADRRLVTNHDSLGYFADRYGFEVIGTVIPSGSTLADPSSRELASLIELMRTEGISTIFAETTLPDVLANTVALELGESVRVVNLYTGSLGEQGSGAETLVGMLTTNATRISEALGG